MKALLLLASDARRLYAEDVQTVLAAPQGSTVMFRYSERWIAPEVLGLVQTDQLREMPVILAFYHKETDGEAFVLPIRHATVVRTTEIAASYGFELRVSSYVDLSEYDESMDSVMAKSGDIVGGLPLNNDGATYPATMLEDQVPAVGRPSDIAKHWGRAARLLALHPSFENSYFLRISRVENSKGRELQFDARGRLAATGGVSVRIITSVYGKRYEPDDRFRLSCKPDGPVLQSASAAAYEIRAKHDSVEFWLHPTAESFDTLSQLTVRLADEQDRAGQVPAEVRLLLVVRRSRSRVFRRWATASSGAVLVAMPAILGPDSSVAFRIGSALIGAGLLAFSGAVLESPR